MLNKSVQASALLIATGRGKVHTGKGARHNGTAVISSLKHSIGRQRRRIDSRIETQGSNDRSLIRGLKLKDRTIESSARMGSLTGSENVSLLSEI